MNGGICLFLASAASVGRGALTTIARMDDEAGAIQLDNHFLIAMPGVRDEPFARSVVYVCEHSPHGAMGFIINKPGSFDMRELFRRVNLPLGRAELGVQPVFLGGPLQPERGFVLHERMTVEGMAPDESLYASTLSVAGGLEVTASRDVLEAVAAGGGPPRLLMALGFSSWGAGQLEAEIARNDWLTVGADVALMFEAPVEQRYERALALLGMQAWMLTSEAGHA